MRYTTIIDITELPEVYRSVSARVLYLHLVCVSGYHTDNQDQVRKSVRSLAYETGLTLSAVRHAMAVLQSADLVSRDGGCFTVRKYVQPILATRPKNADPVKDGTEQAVRQENEKRRLTEELDRLRRFYLDAKERGDDASMKEINTEAQKVKRRLKSM